MDYLALEKYGSGAVEVDDLVFIPDAGEKQVRAHRRNTLETQPPSCAGSLGTRLDKSTRTAHR